MSHMSVAAPAPLLGLSPKSPLRRFFAAENRYLPPLFITLILLVGQLSFGLLESFSRTALAIGASIACEIVLSEAMSRKFPHLASAYISGISVGILVRSPEFWPYALCSVLAITSKYVIRWHGRHLWNPSNFAISAMLLLAPEYVATLSIQWGNSVWPMLIVWALGLLIVMRVNRAHITLTYVAAFIALSFARSLITGHPFLSEVAPITGPMYQLFIFFMITDPKTTMRSSRRAQCAVVICVALVEFALRLAQNIHAPYYALTMVGPAAVVIEILLTRRREAEFKA